MKKSTILFMKSVTKINTFMVYLVGILISIVSIFLFIDVLLRYFFNSPTHWAFDLATKSTGFIGFVLGGYALLTKQHIRVDFLFERLSKKKKALIDLITALFIFLMAGSFIWLGLDYVRHYFELGAMSSGGLRVPLWFLWSMVPLGGVLLALQGLVNLINDIAILATGGTLYEHEPKEEE
jgi:C4-dicarboxylate transporter, DctQ subunit